MTTTIRPSGGGGGGWGNWIGEGGGGVGEAYSCYNSFGGPRVNWADQIHNKLLSAFLLKENKKRK